MLTVTYAECHIKAPYVECRYVECRYAECRYAACRYAACRYAECHYATNTLVSYQPLLNYYNHHRQLYKLTHFTGYLDGLPMKLRFMGDQLTTWLAWISCLSPYHGNS
jgi:hypothetical protein